MPKPAFPHPAAALPGEADILANVLADLADHDAKLVYADWLEERDDPRGPLLREFISAYRAGKRLPTLKAAPKSWRDLVGLSLIAKFRGTDLASKTDKLLAFARPSITYVVAKAAEKTLPVGASKIGGRPDMPEDTEWPRYEDEPLSFLGQFNLAELHSSPAARELPASGLLSAFCLYRGFSSDDFLYENWKLFYFPNASKLVRHELDSEIADGSRWVPSCRIEYTETLSLPATESPWSRELKAIGDMKSGGTYDDISYDICNGDHILGHPEPLQGDMLDGKKSKRHLLTICEGTHTGWEFGEAGAIYFTLDEKDLKAGRFDRVNMQMDCG